MQRTVIAMAGAVALLLVGAAARTVFADAKDDFKRGCESGNRPGSFVENADNVQCNSTSGTTITCDKGVTKCSVSAQITKPFQPTKANFEKYMHGALTVTGWTVVVPAKDKR